MSLFYAMDPMDQMLWQHSTQCWNKSHFLKKDFIYLFMRETHRERQRHRQREKQASFREPNEGLNPQPGSYPEPKADAQPLSHPGIPVPAF